MFSILYTHIKMDKVFREPPSGDLHPMALDEQSTGEAQGLGLHPMTHKEFNEFIKGKDFKGGNNYKLRDLKAMFGFKPMVTGSPVTISSDGMELTRFDSMSKASTSTGIPYITLLYVKRNSRQGAHSHRVHSNGKEYTIIYH